jgi:hypothetical protein
MRLALRRVKPRPLRAILLLACGAVLPSRAAVDFERDIHPIFAARCVECHGPQKQKNGFRLDRRADALRGGDSGQPAIVASNSAASALLARVTSADKDEMMPPKGERLTANQVALLRAWIDAGAPWPEGGRAVHWAFVAPTRPPLPKVKNRRWVRNPIDAFVLARLERERIAPSPEAGRTTLIRRLSLDLTGLPPTPEQARAFLDDRRADAYERLVDALLASPHFGERWGRHWLDLARYADSEGYQIDRPRPHAYVYRDWVIDSFNRDQPFDRFTLEQIAGDLLPEDRLDQKIATGFHRNTLMNWEDGVDREEFRCKAKVDRVNTTGTAWLGLTLGCAQCHSHKYDPITQREFFQLYAFFNSAEEADISAPSPRDKEAKAQAFRELEKPPVTRVHVRGDFLRLGDEVQPGVPASLPPLKPSAARASRLDLARWLADPANPLTARVAVNHLWQHLFGRGLVNTPEDFGTRGEPPSHPDLLDWLAVTFAAPPNANPQTPNAGPACGWSRKALIRLIVTSATYRQSSRARPELRERDPFNVLLARQNRFRLEAEIIRDISLAAGGLLNAEVGGPSFRPFLPEDVKKLGAAGAFQWTDSTGPERYRRGLYIFAQRTVPYPTAMTFDQANSSEACPRRERSNTPLQALTLLNHGVFVECAQALAQRMARHPAADPREKLAHGFECCVARQPDPAELRRLEALFADELKLARRSPEACARLAPAGEASGTDRAAFAALVNVAQVLLNLDEFVTRE